MIRSNQSHEQGILTRYWAIPLDQSALSTTRHYRHTPGFQLITLNCGGTLLEGEYHVYRHQSNPIVAPAHLEITTFAEASLPGLPEHHGTLETRSPAPRHTHASGWPRLSPDPSKPPRPRGLGRFERPPVLQQSKAARAASHSGRPTH